MVFLIELELHDIHNHEGHVIDVSVARDNVGSGMGVAQAE